MPAPEFVSETARCGYDMRKPPMGRTHKYYPLVALIEAPQIAVYHKNLHVDSATESILCRLHNRLMH